MCLTRAPVPRDRRDRWSTSTGATTAPLHLAHMAVADRAERARGSFERRMWGDAFDRAVGGSSRGAVGGRGSRAPRGCRVHGRERRRLRRGLDRRPPRVVAPRRSGARRTLCVLAGARALLPGRPGAGDGLGRPRRPALGGQPPRLRRAGLAADAHGACRACSRETQTCTRASSRRARSPSASRDRRRDDVRAARPRIRADPAGTSRRGHGAAGRGHGRRHGRRGGADARRDRLLPGDRPVPGGVRSPSREGVDGGAHALVRLAARPRSVPGQLPRPSLRDLPVAGRVDGRPRVRPPSVRVARRPTGLGRARIGLLPAGRDPAAARRARGGRGVLPPSQPGGTGPRARDVVAPLGAGASRSRSSGDPPRAGGGAGSDRSVAPAPGLCRGHARGRRRGGSARGGR